MSADRARRTRSSYVGTRHLASLRHDTLERARTDDRRFEQHARNDQEIDRADHPHQPHGQNRAAQRPGRATGGNEAEEALALFGIEYIRHERPEHGHREQVEYADPDEENTGDFDTRNAEPQQQPEDGDVGCEEVIDERDEALARQTRHDGAKQRDRGKHHDEGGAEEPVQVLHAPGNAHLITQRPQYIIGGQQAEEIRE